MGIFFLILAVLVNNAFSSQEIPIPMRTDGVKIGRLNSTFIMEAHYDLLCPGSKEAFMNVMKVIEDYTLLEQNFLLTIHLFPLPYHTFSFKLTAIEKFIEDNYGDLAALNYIRFILENQDSYSNSNLYNLTDHQINDLVSDDISANFNGTIKKSDILDSLHNGTYNEEARISWKLGCHKSVAGTPTHYINGIRVNDSWEFEYEDWVNFFKDYFPMKRNVIITLKKEPLQLK